MTRRPTALDQADRHDPLANFAASLRSLRDNMGGDAPPIDSISLDSGIPRSTLYAALQGRRLPGRKAVTMLVRAWGGDEAAFLAKRSNIEEQLSQGRSGVRDGQKNGIPWLVPSQLPPSPELFVGREGELEVLAHWLRHNRGSGPKIVALSGMAGIGKSQLALAVANQVKENYPDGLLYADLAAFDGTHTDLNNVLAHFSRSLGTPPSDSASVGERSAHYRSLLHEKRVLIVIDNATDSSEVRPLLPGPGKADIIVTTRRNPVELVIHFDALNLAVSTLPPDDSLRFLKNSLGDRASQEPEAVAQLVSLCGGVPLALRIIAEQVVSFPYRPISELAAKLHDESSRLQLLSSSTEVSMRAVLTHSIEGLSKPTVLMFRLLGKFAGKEFTAADVAAVAGVSAEAAAVELDELSRSHLVEPASATAYRMHDLVAVFAAELAERSAAEA